MKGPLAEEAAAAVIAAGGRRGLRAVAVALLVPLPAFARAPEESLALKPEARAHLDAGLQAYHDRSYDLAIREVLAAQSIDPRPELLYTLGQIERHRGNCKGAVVHYRAYLDAAPDPESARAAQSQIDACAVEAPRSVPAAARPPPIPSPRPWYRDTAGGALFASGLLLAGAAIGLLSDAAVRAGDGRSSYDGFASARTWVPVEEGVGIASAALAAVLLAGGVVRWADRAPRARLSLQLGPERAALVIGGSF